MARFFPPLNGSKARMTPGEARFAARLHTNLDDDFYCWHDVAIGLHRSRYPDFIILNADLGLLSIEVKDWKLDAIRTIDKHSVTLLVGGAAKRVANPMEQSRQATYAVVQRLERDEALLRHSGQYEGRLRFPYGFGVAFPNIGSEQVAGIDGWADLFPPHRTIYRDQMTESVDSDDFRARMEDFFELRFGHPLTESMMDRVRWHLFPEIRIGEQKEMFAEDIAAGGVMPDASKIRLFDVEQERRARQIGDGHRVIRGVAGSGKTQIVAYRCQHVAQASSKPILALYYNIAAKALLKNALAARGVLDRVHVRHFHQWCAEQVRAAGRACGKDAVAGFSQALADGALDATRYGAVVIDEGQDFEREWIAGIAAFCAGADLPLLFVYDDAQSIYEKRTGLGFTLASAGIKAQGRTTVLKTNYRNTRYVQQLASRLLHDTLERADTDRTAPREEWLHPVSVGAAGARPRIAVCDGAEDEGARIVRWLGTMHGERGVPWRDICVVLRSRAETGEQVARLIRHGIPAYDLSESRASKEGLDLSAPTVKVTTVHSSKGLEFPCIVVPRLCGFAHEGERAVEDARLLYVALTRSTDRLILTARRETPLVARMDGYIAQIAATLAAPAIH